MKQIILIRHTESEKNTFDSDLTDKGRKQASQITTFLKKYSYEAIFTSLYQRSQLTAKEINKNNIPFFSTNAFNEYYVRPDGTNVEGISEVAERAMSKIYSIFNNYKAIAIVGHSSINQTILQSILNLNYEEARKYFNNFGEAQVLRYDYEKGDGNWKIVDSFIPSQ